MNNYDVFISYSYKDKKIADAICHYFENDQLKCWIAPRDILPGMQWAKSIVDAIPKCSILLLIFSSHSNASSQVLREIELAVSYGKIIVPVRIEDIRPTQGMEYYLATVHWINILDKKIEGKLIELTETIRNIINANKNLGQDIAIVAKKEKKKKSRAWILVLTSILLAAGAVIFVFRESIFTNLDRLFSNTAPETLNAAATAKSTVSPAETSQPAATPMAQPTATIDPDIAPDTAVDMPDSYLRSAVMQALDLSGHPVNDAIKVSDMLNLEQIFVNSYERFEAEKHDVKEKEYTVLLNNDITSLEGLQYAQNLTSLSIEESDIQDINVLSQIHSLVGVSISNSRISDISPLTSSRHLEYVWLGGNQIQDIEPLAELYKIKELGINGNPLNSVSVLLDLPNLRVLDATNLTCEDIDKILLLKDLEFLRIGDSALLDLSPLLAFENLKTLYIDYGQYHKNVSIVEELVANGCDVHW